MHRVGERDAPGHRWHQAGEESGDPTMLSNSIGCDPSACLKAIAGSLVSTALATDCPSFCGALSYSRALKTVLPVSFMYCRMLSHA